MKFFRKEVKLRKLTHPPPKKGHQILKPLNLETRKKNLLWPEDLRRSLGKRCSAVGDTHAKTSSGSSFQLENLLEIRIMPGEMAHTCNPAAWTSEAGGSHAQSQQLG